MSEEKKKKTCFIISPLGSENSKTRRNADGLIKSVIKPVAESLNLEYTASHIIDSPGSITNQIIEQLLEADLVIANLTELNANVMYELAVRHCVRKPVVIIAENGTDLPFDIKIERTVFYENDMMGVDVIKPTLKNAINEALKDNEPDNPVYRVIQKKVIKEVSAPDDIQKYILSELQRISDNLNKQQRSTTITNGSERTPETVHFSLLMGEKEWTEKEVIDELLKLGVVAVNFVEKISAEEFEVKALFINRTHWLSFSKKIDSLDYIDIQYIIV